MSKNRNCGNCGWSSATPPFVRPYYGYGGLMLACCNPNKRGAKKGVLVVAPLCECAKWKPKETEVISMEPSVNVSDITLLNQGE